MPKPRKQKAKRRPKVVAVPVEHLTYVEEAYRAITKAWRRLKKRMK